jgi:hypothetical protein
MCGLLADYWDFAKLAMLIVGVVWWVLVGKVNNMFFVERARKSETRLQYFFGFSGYDLFWKSRKFQFIFFASLICGLFEFLIFKSTLNCKIL